MATVQSRRWLVTINNPGDKGLSHDAIKDIVAHGTAPVYWCMCDEVGDECETLHTHLYFVWKSPVRFDKIRKMFDCSHCDKPNGTSPECRAYVLKDGEKFNKDEDDPDYVLVTIQDVMDALAKYQVTDETESEAQSEGSEKTGIFTTKGNPVDPSEYEPLMPFVDLVITNGVDVRYDLENPVTAKMKVEVVKKFAKEDLLLMQVDPFTGRYYFIELDECDAETGEITAEFPCLGPFTVLAKSEAIAALAAADAEASTEAATEAATE